MSTSSLPENDSSFVMQDAASITEAICARVAKAPLDTDLLRIQLHDLKNSIVAACAKRAPFSAPFELRNELARNLPDFNVEGFYQKRSSTLALALDVFIGWILGGLLSGLLSILGMGGDIIRVGCIFALLWLNEALATNPGARKMLLTALGLGGLGRFASLVSGGMLRIFSFSGWRNIIFGSARVNIFKYVWLMAGALFVFAFFSKKVSALDMGAFKAGLTSEIEQRMRLVDFVFDQLGKLQAQVDQCRKLEKNGACLNKKCALASAATELMPVMEHGPAQLLAQALKRMGFEPLPAEETFIWDEERDAPLYERIGLIKNGDHCIALKAPIIRSDMIIKGHAQRLDPQG